MKKNVFEWILIGISACISIGILILGATYDYSAESQEYSLLYFNGCLFALGYFVNDTFLNRGKKS